MTTHLFDEEQNAVAHRRARFVNTVLKIKQRYH